MRPVVGLQAAAGLDWCFLRSHLPFIAATSVGYNSLRTSETKPIRVSLAKDLSLNI